MSTTKNIPQTRQTRPARAARYLRRFLYFTVALILVLLVLPYIIRYELIEALRDAGADSVQIDDIDYNPFTAVISVKMLSVENNQKTSLRVSSMQLNVGYFPVLRRRLIINHATLQDAEVLIEQNASGKLIIAGLNMPETTRNNEPDDNTWQAGIESLTLHNTRIRAHLIKQHHLLQIESAKLEKLLSWDLNNKAHLTLDGQINDAKLELDIDMGLFGDSLDVSGKMRLDTLELQPLVPDLYGQLTVAGTMNIKLEKQGTLQIRHNGNFMLSNAKYTRPELVFSASEMSLSGKNSLTLAKELSNGDTVTFTHSGSLIVNQSSFLQPENNIELLRISKLNARRINIQSRHQIELADISLAQTDLLVDRQSSAPVPVARSELITIDQIRLNDLNKLELGNIIIDTLQLAIKRDKQGALNPLNRLLAEKINDKQAPQSDNKISTGKNRNLKQKPGMGFKLASLAITGESHIQIDDESVQPAYRSRLQIKKIELGKMDNAQIQQPTSLLIELLPAKFGSVKLSGNIFPFTARYDLDLNLTTESISLPRLTPYLRHYTGYLFRQGQLDSNSTLKSTDGALKGQINMVARKLEMAPVSTEKARLVRQQLGMPLEQALSMLRDSDNNITLEIPVSGNTSNPDFSINNVINIAITKAIKTGAKSYLLYALGPYGIALALADSAINSGGYIRLSDIEYEAGQTAFPEEQHNYLQRLQKITQERPEVELHLCAHATEHDRQMLANNSDTQNFNHEQQPDRQTDNSAILKLAEKRMLNLKAILIKKYSINAERIKLCKPFLDEDKYANPHVEISL